MKIVRGYYFSMTKWMPGVLFSKRGVLVYYPTGMYAKHFVAVEW